MSRDSESRKGFGNFKAVSVERALADQELDVVVLKDATVFERFLSDIFQVIEERWSAYHFGAPMPVSEVEFTRYAYTAVKTRVARARNERFHIRCDADWVLPTGLASVLAGIGRVTMEKPVVTLKPKWDEANDEYLLSLEEFHSISRRMRIFETDPDCKFVFAHAIAKQVGGDESLMSLIPVRDNLGRLVEIRSRIDFDVIAGVSYLILDLMPDGFQDGGALEFHPLLVPPFLLRVAAVMQYMTRYAEASVG